jgi:potassium channel subfamily K
MDEAEIPRCYWLNVASLTCGFLGNIFLLFNFTRRIRYIIALPATIILLLSATTIVSGIATLVLIKLTCQLLTIVVRMHILDAPTPPFEAYSQGFWYAIIAAVIYFVSCCTLILNMFGYFLGHYHQRFELNDHQRTLIIQTMLFFAWLAGGGALFSKIESIGNTGSTWEFVDGVGHHSLYNHC